MSFRLKNETVLPAASLQAEPFILMAVAKLYKELSTSFIK